MLIRQPLAYEHGEGVWGNREVPPLLRRRGSVGETGFPPRERAEGEGRSCSVLRVAPVAWVEWAFLAERLRPAAEGLNVLVSKGAGDDRAHLAEVVLVEAAHCDRG